MEIQSPDGNSGKNGPNSSPFAVTRRLQSGSKTLAFRQPAGSKRRPIDSKAMTFESHLASGTHQRTATNCQACPRSNLSEIRPGSVPINTQPPRCSTPFVRFSAIRPHF
jgi:hypothetical protein